MIVLSFGTEAAVVRSYLASMRRRISPPKLLAHVDSPDSRTIHTDRRALTFRGWAISQCGREVTLRIRNGDQTLAETPCDQARGDVFQRHARRFGLNHPFCGFEAKVDLFQFITSDSGTCTLDFHAGESSTTAGPYRVLLATGIPHGRGEYKDVWNTGTHRLDHARLVIAGGLDDEIWRATATGSAQLLRDAVGIAKSDVILEIGCGIGRVGEILAPLCREWIGGDVSDRMLEHMAHRLSHLPNVRPLPLNGYDLRNVPTESVDVVYATAVFLHLDEWERYRYVKDGFRVLRPGGRMMVDGYNLLTDSGWRIFQENEDYYHPRVRPPSVSRASTPQELETYFRRAGYEDIRQAVVDPCVYTWGRKPDR